MQGDLHSKHLDLFGGRPAKVVGISGILKSQVNRICEEIDGPVKAFLERPTGGGWRYM